MGMKNFTLMLVKFTQPEFMDSIANGQLYMNNIDYFVELENKTKVKGQGDKFDGANVIRHTKFKLIDSETKEVVLEGISPEVIQRDYAISKIPVYCMTAFKGNDFAVVDETSDSYIAKLDISEDVKELMLSTFGSKAVIINPFCFIKSVQKHFDDKQIDFYAQLVEYSDFNLNLEERMLNYQNRNITSIFTKDLFFEHQREFRIALYNTAIEEPLVINLSTFEDSLVSCTDTLSLFNDFEIEIPK
ncbi:hypothetical protein SAMN05428961_11084 [Paenibacillus sp. OK060]|nr:hypothetical protein SAMN05428961_11084 [Paenibacillus sp. OK060]